jgi:hypothetical protein
MGGAGTTTSSATPARTADALSAIVPIDGRWNAVAVDESRCLVYGPRTGRLYLMTRQQLAEPRLRTVMGLNRYRFDDALADPATSIAHDAADLKTAAPMRAGPALRVGYWGIDRSRFFLPLAAAAILVTKAAAHRRAPGPASPARAASEIGRRLHAVERGLGRGDCYPRAFAAAFLAIASGFACRLAIGVLAPTRKMHAWCSIDGLVPYEPTPEHYLYRPLVVVTLSP